MSLGGTLTTDRNAPTINSRKQRVYDDFSSPTAIRQDRIIVENKSIYVNLGYLAEYSSFFANSYEQKENPIRLNNHSYEDMLELMRCLFFCPQRKEITHANISTIIDLANEFDMEPVMRRCEDVISRQAGSFSPNRIFQLTRSLSKHQRNSHSMSVLMDKLARMDEHQLNTLPFDNIPGDVVADLYAVKLRQSVENRRQKFELPWWKRFACCCFISSTDQEVSDNKAKKKPN